MKMNARYVQRGESIDFTPTSDINAGDVVKMRSLVGIAKLDIRKGELGALALTGVYEFKVAASETVDPGDEVYFDPVTGTVSKTPPGTGGTSFAVGYAVAASTADALVLVKLEQGL